MGVPRLTRYRNLSGESGVTGYALGDDWIVVRFAGGAVYRYTEASAGAEAVREMRAHARAGRGLSAYIARHVHDRYEARLA